MIGRELSHFRVLEQLGAGGMGVVYRGVDVRLNRPVAIKLLPASATSDPLRRERFVREARAASALNHPNIVTIHEIDSDGEQDFIVMELVEGHSLRDAIPPGGLTPKLALAYAVQLARGLAAAHEKGIVHRDLNPENVIVTKDGRVKILDFGLARLTQEEDVPQGSKASTLTEMTAPGTVLGTVGYMSPEQVHGRRADHRSDIFAFGTILYEMLTGQRAFQRDSRVETLNAILKEEPPALERPASGIAPGVERIVRQCLEKEPGRRFQSAHDLAFALEVPGELRLPARKGAIDRRRIRAVGVGLVLTLLLALAGLDIGGVRSRLGGGPATQSVRSLVVLPLQDLSRDPEQDYFADGMTDALIGNLSKIAALRVISRTSAMRYKATSKPLPEIARELNVDAIVEGSVLRSGDRVRISAQLVHAGQEKSLWSENVGIGLCQGGPPSGSREAAEAAHRNRENAVRDAGRLHQPVRGLGRGVGLPTSAGPG